jgi:two-component system LytT family response regulator
MRPLRAVIADDEEPSRACIRHLLGAHPDVSVVAECSEGYDAISQIRSERPDLLFLDVEMPGVDGLGVLQAVGVGTVPAVLFLTAHDRYALEAFGVEALDYLLKPCDGEHFAKALVRARLQIEGKRRDLSGERLARSMNESPTKSKYLERFVIRSGDRILFRSVNEVEWIEADANYARLHLGKETQLIRESMNVIESKLDPVKFVRIHRSTIVRIDIIKELRPAHAGERIVMLQSGEGLRLGRAYRQHFRTVLGDPR